MNHRSRARSLRNPARRVPLARAAASPRLSKYLLAGGLLSVATPLWAQDATPSVPVPTPSIPVPIDPAAPVPAAPAAPATPVAPAAPVGGTGLGLGTLSPGVPALPSDPLVAPQAPPDPTPGLGDARLAQSEGAPELGVIEAISQALLNNPSRKEARFALEAANQRIGTARSAGGLQVTGSVDAGGTRGFLGGGGSFGVGGGGGGNAGGNPGGVNLNLGNRLLGFNTNYSAGLSVGLPLYTGGRVSGSKRVAEANARAQAARVMQVDQELVLQVSLAYIDVLRGEQILRVADSNLEVSRERRRVAAVRFDAGAAARLEVLRADTTLATAQQSHVTAVNGLAQNKGALNTLMGRPPETPLKTQSLASLTTQFGASLPLGAFGLPDVGEVSSSAISGLPVPGSTAPVGRLAPNNTTPLIPTPSTSAAVPNVSTPGANVPGSVIGNAGAAGTSIGSGAGGVAPGVSVPGVSAPGAGGTAVGGSSGTVSSGTVLTNPAGVGGAASGAAPGVGIGGGIGGVGVGGGIGIGGAGAGGVNTAGAAQANAAGAAGGAGNLAAAAGALTAQSGAALRASAAGGRQSLAVTNAQIEAAEAAVTVAKAQKKPDINLSLGGFFRSPASFLGRFLLNLGVGIAQNVFDSGRTRSQVREAQATVNQLKESYAGQQLQVAQQIEQSLLTLDSAQRRQGSADVSVTSSVEALRSAQLGYEAGVLTNLDVNDAQAALLASQIDAINTRFDVAQAQASLTASVGVLTPEAREAFRRAVDEEAARLNATPIGDTTAKEPPKKKRKFLGIF